MLELIIKCIHFHHNYKIMKVRIQTMHKLEYKNLMIYQFRNILKKHMLTSSLTFQIKYDTSKN